MIETTTPSGAAVLRISLLADSRFRCTVCGRIGTVGRCCGLDTREPLNDLAKAELAADEKRMARLNRRRAGTMASPTTSAGPPLSDDRAS